MASVIRHRVVRMGMSNDTMRCEPDPVDVFLSAHREPPTLRAPSSAVQRRLWLERTEYQLAQTRKANADVMRFERNMAKPTAKSELVAYALLFVLLTALAWVAAGGMN